MSSRAQLRIAGAPRSFAETMTEEAVPLAVGLAEAQQFARTRLNGAAFLARACELAGSTREEIEALDERLLALPQVETYRPVQVFAEWIYNHARSPSGYAEPPQLHELPTEAATRIPDAILAMVCADLGVRRLQLAAVAALRATRDAPEVFALGCDSCAAHQANIRAVERKLRDALERAATTWTRADITYKSSFAGFVLSNGQIGVGNGEGDVTATENLLRWLVANRAHEEA
jgi:hypothetical protein